MDQLAHHHVGLPEGQALLHQVVGAVGGVDEAAVQGGPAHVFGLDGHGLDHGGEDGQAHLHGVDGVEDGFLVLLHVLVVGQGDALHDGEQGDEGAIDPAGLTTDQLGHVGVLLLGHHGGAGGVGVVQLHILELPGAPQDDFLGEAAQVHHEDGAGGQELNGEVTIGDGVQGVVSGLGEAQQLCGAVPVDGIGGGGQSTGTQGGLVHALQAVLQTGHVTLEHVGVGHQVVGQSGGLGTLQVGVAGQQGVDVLLGLVHQDGLKVQNDLDDVLDLLPDIHPEVHGHLVVPATGGVEALGGLADAAGEQSLDVHVDVFHVHGELHVACFDVSQDGLQAVDDILCLLGRDDALFPQHGGVGDGAGDVLAV